MSDKESKTEEYDPRDSLPGLSAANTVLDLDQALASAGDQFKVWSVAAFRLYGILGIAFLASLSYGFDNSLMGSVNGLTQYTDYFHIKGGSTGGGQGITTAMLFNIFSLGGFAGALISGPAADRWGRRVGMLIASFFLLIGVSLVTAAQNRAYLFVGRFLLGFGSCINNSAAPPYIAEMAPPQWRGHMAGAYNTFNFIGGIVCSALVIGTGNMKGSISWRLPFALQFIPTVALIVGVIFIPESPRWLMSVGRKEEARAILAKYQGNGDPNAPLVVLQMQEMESSIRNYHDVKWTEMFSTRSARIRIAIPIWLGICYICSGFSIFNYSTVAFFLTGVRSQHARLIFSFVSSAAGGAGSLFGAIFADRVGRRPLWLFGAFSCCITLCLTAAFTARSIAPAAITFLVMFSFVMNATYMPMQGMYPSECLPFAHRAKGFAVIALIDSACALIGNFAGSVAFDRIGWKYFLVFGVWNAFLTLTVYFVAVETKGRTLEELDEIFEAPNPVKASLRPRVKQEKQVVVDEKDEKS
ncbi:general substrate transporter [Roridomyces roridus]|uniref:General substrate transporter n=1 Tax=Roridomyces roridus TaxID=1738132 RepID=A0AAD7C5I4_9AGAR|nr:general substrate transporter [Roridomyces roridus]